MELSNMLNGVRVDRYLTFKVIIRIIQNENFVSTIYVFPLAGNINDYTPSQGRKSGKIH